MFRRPYCSQLRFLSLELTLIFHSKWVFQTSFNWWYFTGIHVTAILLRILLRILADFNIAVDWMVFAGSPVPPVSDSAFWWPFQSLQLLFVSASFPCSTPFHLPGNVQLFVYLFVYVYLHPMFHWNSKIYKMTDFSLFLLTLGLIHWQGIGWSICMPNFQIILCVSHSWWGSCYHLPTLINVNHLHNFRWITSPLFLLYQFNAIAYYVFNSFISVNTLPTLVILCSE